MKEKVMLISFLLLFMAVPLYGGSVQDFSFTDLDGKVYTQANLMGTFLVINIGAHW